jgi:hypothetical protein
MTVKLIYQMFAKLLSWMVLHARSATANTATSRFRNRHGLTGARVRHERLPLRRHRGLRGRGQARAGAGRR